MRLVSLRLVNFKGCRDLTVVAGGEDLTVFGDNGSGKTTLADSFFWLLFGKDSRNKADFEIKTIDKATGEPVHKHVHEVEGVFELASGDQFSLKRSYAEKWTRQRGSAQTSFTGHETDYFVDGVQKDKRDFEVFVSKVCDEKRFRLLSDPTYFCEQVKWEERRRVLVDMVGDVTDEQVAASSPALGEVLELLGKHSADDKRAMLTSQRKMLNERLKALPLLVGEATRTVGEGFSGAIQDTSVLDDKVASLQTKLASARNGGAVTQLRLEAQILSGKMLERETALKKEAGSGFDSAQERVRSAQQALTLVQGKAADAAAKVDMCFRLVSKLDDDLNRLRAEHAGIKAKEFIFLGTDTCPTCMRSLPPADVEEARTKAQSDFNEKQARELELNIERGKASKQAWLDAEGDLNRAREEQDRAQSALLEAQEALSAAKSDAQKLELPAVDLEADPDYAALVKQKSDIDAKINDEASATAEAVHAAEQELETARAELAEIAKHNAEVDAAGRARKRVAELEDEEKKVSIEFEELERQLFLIEEFARAKARMLTEIINSRFSLVSWKLFDEQINGGLSECCEAMVGSVPYGSLNHGSRLNAGLDIIDTLGKEFGFTPCIWIDNSESVTSIRPTEAQQIRLVVSAKDKSLRFEGSKTLKKAS